ncbi:MAG: glycine--tRNA ligase subunit beta, partial [Betaproteobacteria bacterium]|nr:glycine--tRNA ligase subunit beta [Betaproteobacteria bacterium]
MATSPATGTATLLVEIFTEELPPKALKSLGAAFADVLRDELARRSVLTESTVVTPYATPRRLAVSMSQVRRVAPDAEIIEKLMPRSVAEDAAGKATVALRRRLDKAGRGRLAAGYPDARDGPDHLYVASEGKADQVWLRTLAASQPLERALQEALDEAITRLPIPKLMSYPSENGYYNDVRFVRPAHRLVALHGGDVVPVSALGLTAGRSTGGHRFMGRAEIDIEAADAYAPTLEAEGKVMPDFAQRRAEIVRQLVHAAEGASVIMPDALLDEVTSLVEWPAVYAGTFDRAFLEVPQECLILTMQQNQKYFALADAQGA